MESNRPAVVPAAEAPAPVCPLDARAGLGPGSLLLDEVLLAPFLSPRDLVRLSQGAKWLLPYRTQLIKVTIKHYDPHMRNALLRQRHLRAIELGAAEDVESLMDVVREGLGGTLRSLHVRWCKSPSAGRHVGACLAAGGCPVLERLAFTAYKCESVCAVVPGLVGCPRLLELHLGLLSVAGGEALAAALAEGTVPELRHLKLVWDDKHEPQPSQETMMARVLQAFPQPKLRALSMTFRSRGTRGDEGVVAIVDALRAETYRGLTSLELGDWYTSGIPENGLEALGNALVEGAWPHFESLDTFCKAASTPRLADALRWGRLPCLKHLSLVAWDGGGGRGEVAVAICEALSAGRCRTLETLHLFEGAPGCWKVARAMEEGGLPRLRVLTFTGYSQAPGWAVRVLAGAIEGGAGANLTQLSVATRCGESLARLDRAKKGGCPKIRRAWLDVLEEPRGGGCGLRPLACAFEATKRCGNR
jgi:hypothetical protein